MSNYNIGDWVILTFPSLDRDDDCVIQIRGIKDNVYYYDKECKYPIEGKHDKFNNESNWYILELWKPKKGEWCWFYTNEMKENKYPPFLAQSNGSIIILNDGTKICRLLDDRMLPDHTYCSENIEPYTGNIPSYLN